MVLLFEIPRGERQRGVEGCVPVFPVVDAVADAELVVDAGPLHQAVDLDGQVEEEIIVAAVEEPCDGTELLQRRFVCVPEEIEAGMIVNGLADQGEAVGAVQGPHFILPIVQPGAHGVTTGEAVGMTLRIGCAAATAHGEAHDGAMRLVADAAIPLLYSRHELAEKEIFIIPAGHVEIAIPLAPDVGMAGVRHDDDHRSDLAGCNEQVGDIFDAAVVIPSLVGIRQAVQQIDDGIGRVGILETGRKIHVERDFLPENLALDAVGQDRSLCRSRRPGQQNGDAAYNTAQQFLHGITVFCKIGIILKLVHKRVGIYAGVGVKTITRAQKRGYSCMS